MAAYIYWFMLALVLLGLEMTSGTFYMLVLSMAVALGGVAALAGLGLVWQLSLAGAAAVIGTLILRHSRITRPADAKNDSFDIGQPVQVIAWNENGTARVHYRGAEWDALPEGAVTSPDAAFYIKAVQGSKLILTQQKP
jgi:membrane protein implicated in regulation of membrane protease activity